MRYHLSVCCNAYCYVPVDVTAHLYLSGDGRATNALADSRADLRRQAISYGADPAEAYCSECGAEVWERTDDGQNPVLITVDAA